MKKLLFIMLLGFVFNTNGQESAEQAKRSRYIRIPSQSGLVFISFQPNSPLKFEHFEMLVEEDGSPPLLRYSVRNTSTKAVRFFLLKYYQKYTVRLWGQTGMSNGLGVGREDGLGPDLIVHNDTFENIRSEQIEIVPMNDRVGSLLKSKDGDYEMKIAFFAYVEKVVFEDGSVFEETQIPENIRNFFFSD